MLQTGLAFHARSIVNYASFEAARAGSIANAGLASMRLAFARAMTPYYGGGRNLAELADAFAAAQIDLAAALRIEIVSPTRESFDDYHSLAGLLCVGLGVVTGAPVVIGLTAVLGLAQWTAATDVPASEPAAEPSRRANGVYALEMLAAVVVIQLLKGLVPTITD